MPPTQRRARGRRRRGRSAIASLLSRLAMTWRSLERLPRQRLGDQDRFVAAFDLAGHAPREQDRLVGYVLDVEQLVAPADLRADGDDAGVADLVHAVVDAHLRRRQ